MRSSPCPNPKIRRPKHRHRSNSTKGPPCEDQPLLPLRRAHHRHRRRRPGREGQRAPGRQPSRPRVHPRPDPHDRLLTSRSAHDHSPPPVSPGRAVGCPGPAAIPFRSPGYPAATSQAPGIGQKERGMATPDRTTSADRTAAPAPAIRLPGIVLGIGLGGFVDGILLHQLLQWHHMLTSTGTDNIGLDPYPADTVHGLEINTLWDGLFHTFTWLAVLFGLWLLYSRVVVARG